MLIGAVKAMIDKVLDENGMEKLIGMMKFFCDTWNASQKKPEDN